ncbi:ATP-dependent DNA helicase UvrD [Mesorhizobium alhagi CCNWXJ12-2]|uniref:DNA 3'-5' helicase n=2 Tax=Allomesorhizobium alhagi TaxID=475067 RepID=H0HUR4_9HYPH|nr:ATP-dependent DNA helicase UvrD [Mesorhizobium alhagi CCNWXJ12-2]
MKRRVARLLEVEQIDSAQILAVTFTRVAAEDLHRELVSLEVPGAGGLHGRTLHSLAMSILMRNHVLAVLGRTPRPLNEYELEPLLADLGNHHGNKHARKRLIRAYGAAWARLQTQEPGFARSPADQAFADELVEWLTLHEAMLMDEVIPHLFQYLRGNPGAPERAEYSHLLIDEYQDLNRAEQDSLQFLGENSSICIIGDDDQSIYSFRHAHPDGIRHWAVLHPTDEHAIAECRRCPTTVVRMANTLIARNAGRLGGAMTERAANGPGEVVVCQFGTAEQEATAVATKIASLIEAGVPPREIIVLAQRRTFASPIFHRLRADGIPTKSYYAESALDTVEAQERFAILKLLLNNEDRVALRWLLGRGHPNWHTNPYRRVLEHVRQTGTSLWEALTSLSDGILVIPYTGALVDRFEEIKAELEVLGASADFDDFLQQWLPDNPETELLSETVTLCREGIDNPADLFGALYDAISQPEVPLEVAEVRVMSLHKSKGLSSPYVFIVGCVEGLLPAQLGPETSPEDRLAKLQEDRRLFYVGITRVKSDLPNRTGYLALTYPQTMVASEAFSSQIAPVRVRRGIAYLQPSRFLAEIAPHAPAPQFNSPL